MLSVEQLIGRLNETLDLPTSSTRSAPKRHHTLRNALEWSFRLLSPIEQLVFSELSVFNGGWTLAAAESVCGVDDLEPKRVLEVLDQLVYKSLVCAQPESNTGEIRFSMLQVAGEYGSEQLQDLDNDGWTKRRHSVYFATGAEQAEKPLWEHDVGSWPERLWRDHANLLSALRWAIVAMANAMRSYPLERESFRAVHTPVYFAVGTLSHPIFADWANTLQSFFTDMQVEEYQGRHHLDRAHIAEPERFAAALRALWDRS